MFVPTWNFMWDEQYNFLNLFLMTTFFFAQFLFGNVRNKISTWREEVRI